MKSVIITIIILWSAFSFAQTKKDTLSKSDKVTLKNDKSDLEKKDISLTKLKKIFFDNHITYNPADIEYQADLQRSTLKDIISNGQKTEKNNAEDNAKRILSDVRKNMEDKRSAFQKVVQEALGIAQTAVVVGLAVREVTKKKEK